nr:MAG TPA: hypothetical protein [Caudoviricetes sp.]
MQRRFYIVLTNNDVEYIIIVELRHRHRHRRSRLSLR